MADRKKINQIPEFKETSYRTIFQNSPLGIIRFSVDGTIIDCNNKFIELMDSTRDKLIGFNTPKQSKNEQMKDALAIFKNMEFV